ncbi:MAG TPA: YbdK family carboxylate-amine ligase [Solirubrobacteraceae bacterium]|jgi:carboxylate-amine ligase
MDHRFGAAGTRPFTVGIEEELMILDGQTLDLVSAIDVIVNEGPPSDQIKPELLESVLEIATSPCPDVPSAQAELASLRAETSDRARRHGMQIGASGTHPFARWEDQRVVSDDRYRGLIRSLGFVARQELVFGMHVHVGMADAEETVHVANRIRSHVPLLIALSANSPLWRGEPTGLMSSRIPIFRAFPRVGLPPRFEGWEDFERRVELLTEGGIIEDYTYLWYDVRPHPRLGTIEIRAMDSQTRVEHTAAIAALIVTLVKLLTEEHRDRRSSGRSDPEEPPWELLDENRWLAARHGLEAELLDHVSRRRVPVRELTEALLERLSPHAQELGCAQELEGVRDLLRAGNGALRQQMVFEANRDLRELMAEIVARTAPVPAS